MKDKIELTVVQNFSSEEIANMIAKVVKKEIEHYFDQKDESHNDKHLTREETAEFFKISLTCLDTWSSKGILKRRKVGNRTYFLLSEIKAVLNNSNA